MIRLGLLMLLTLAGIYAVMVTWGRGDLRPDRPAAPLATAAQDAGTPPIASPAPRPVAEPASIIPAASQTPERVVRFPGPELQPSPDQAAPAAASVAVETGAALYVTASRLNMRSGPGPDNPVVLALDQGTRVEPLGAAQGGWQQVRAPGGQQGYVSIQFLSGTP